METDFVENRFFRRMYDLLVWGVAIPNMIIPILVGSRMDRRGGVYLLPASAVAIFLGQFLTFCAYSKYYFIYVLLGRTLLSAAFFSMKVIVSTELSSWFDGKELAFAFAIYESTSILALMIGNMVSPNIATAYDGVRSVFGVGMVMTLFSALVSLYSLTLRRAGLTIENKKGFGMVVSVEMKESVSGSLLVFTMLTSAAMLPYTSALHFPKYYKAVLSTTQSSEVDFDAVRIEGMINAAAVALVPLTGLLMDSFGKRINILVVSAVCVSLAHVMIIYNHTLGAVYASVDMCGIGYRLLMLFFCVKLSV